MSGRKWPVVSWRRRSLRRGHLTWFRLSSACLKLSLNSDGIQHRRATGKDGWSSDWVRSQALIPSISSTRSSSSWVAGWAVLSPRNNFQNIVHASICFEAAFQLVMGMTFSPSWRGGGARSCERLPCGFSGWSPSHRWA